MSTNLSLTPKTPWALIVDEINSLNTDTGANFGLNDLTYALKSVDNEAGTAVLTLSPGAGTPYFNTRDVNYHRLDLAKWFQKIAVRANVEDATTIGAVVDLIAARYGMITADGTPFLNKATDIKADTLDTPVVFTENGIQTVTLTAAEGSIAWFGSVEVTVYNTTLDLANIIKVTDLGALEYVDHGDGTKTSARLVTYPVDLSAYAAGLSAAVVGTPLEAELVDEIVDTIVKETGISDTLKGELTTALTTLAPSYVGTSAEATDTGVNATLTNVVIVDGIASTNLYGSAVLGYNAA